MYDICLLSFCVLLVYGALCDVTTFEIPDFVSVLGALLFVPAVLGADLGITYIAWHLLAGTLVLCIGFALFVANLLGGGDAKVLAAAALWCGLEGLLPLLFWVAIIGGILTLLLILCRRLKIFRRFRSVGWLVRLQEESGVPYSVAITCGTLIIFSESYMGP
tara:strand:+ start:32 stop:517 length:486 start_codon:yes stop_codon:yes gene_type:complete